MNRNIPAQRSIALAQQRLAGRRMPAGVARGNLAGQGEVPAVPQGADAANLAGCGDPYGCGVPSPSPFAGMPQGVAAPYLQPNALLGIFVVPASAQPTTLEISCGNTFFSGCGARSFTPSGTNLLTSIISGFDTRDQLCPGSGIDVAFFDTTDCYCPFDWGCFSNLAPLSITFDPIDTQSVLAPLNMIIVGQRLEFGGCFPFPPGMYPRPVQVPGTQWTPDAPGSLQAPMPPQVNPAHGWGGWGR